MQLHRYKLKNSFFLEMLINFCWALIITSFFNTAFFDKTNFIFHYNKENFFFLITLFNNILLINFLLINFLSLFIGSKAANIILFTITLYTSHFTNTLGIIIDSSMILNLFETNISEARDIINSSLISKTLITLLVFTLYLKLVHYKTRESRKRVFLKKSGIIFFSIFLIIGQVALVSRHYTVFFRGHKELRSYILPTFPLYSFYKYFRNQSHKNHGPPKKIANHIQFPINHAGRELVVLVVGETARADHFSLNGHTKKTNPLLENEGVFSFKNATSCATSTAYSVPCMFSDLTRSQFNLNEAKARENLLDILDRSGNVDIIWRDNNSDSKGVAKRVKFEDYKSNKNNPICDKECRDLGMLEGLSEYVDQSNKADILIVLHQMGSHGPSYYRRYTKEFDRFQPNCLNDDISKCSQEEISNSYDNTILYTDYFLAEIIKFLKTKSEHFATALFYVSDHGESLGENGVYLHGLPYLVAPKAQKNPAMILWLNDELKKTYDTKLFNKLDENYQISHDNIFHSILTLFEVQTDVLDPHLSIFKEVKKD